MVSSAGIEGSSRGRPGAVPSTVESGSSDITVAASESVESDAEVETRGARVLGTSSDLSEEVIIRHTRRLTSVVGTDVGDLMPLWLNDLTMPTLSLESLGKNCTTIITRSCRSPL